MDGSSSPPIRVANAAMLLLALTVTATGLWWQQASVSIMSDERTQEVGDDVHDHGSHGHAGAGHDHRHHGHGAHAHQRDYPYGTEDHDSGELTLSDEAVNSLGLSSEQLHEVSFRDFRRCVVIPGQVTGRPGRTQVHVATPMTGTITHVHVTQGEAVTPGTLLFRIRLTHEDLLQLQTEFLQTIGALDVEAREVRRLESLDRDQAISGLTLLEREYQRDRLGAVRNAQEESLRMHGLSSRQIEGIIQNRRLVSELNVVAPQPDIHPEDEDFSVGAAEATLARPDGSQPILILDRLNVKKGQQVAAGTTLAVLQDYSELLIEGRLLESQISSARQELEKGGTVDVVFDRPHGRRHVVAGLKLQRVDNLVDRTSRSVGLYIRLPNSLRSDRQRGEARYVDWTAMPGERVQIRLPYGKPLRKQIVLPVEAVTQSGSRYVVFRQHDGHFDRVPVRLRHRDAHVVVVDRDGALSRGNLIAASGVHRLSLALQYKAAPDVSIHGHSHPHPH